MPALKNPKHERFCQELAKGNVTADKAYVLAGYNRNRANASQLKSKQHIRARIAELLEASARLVVKDLVITQKSLIREAEEARLLAMHIAQPAAAIAAIKEKGILSGERVEKQELGGHKGGPIRVEWLPIVK